MRRITVLAAILLPVFFLAVFMGSLRTHASPSTPSATFTVNSTDDVVDVNPGDGICETAVGNNICTLRAAIQETNALPGADTILLSSETYTLTIVGTNEDQSASGDLDIIDNLAIVGNTATTINGNELDRVIHIFEPAVVTISNIIITKGLLEPFSVGGGINNQGSLTLSESSIISNTGNADTSGAGIFSNNLLNIENSQIANNQGATGISGNGILTLTNSRLENNGPSSNFGGGINFGGGEITIISSTINNNSSNFEGGGLYFTSNNLLKVKIIDSVIHTNFSGSQGGGIIFRFNVVADITNSTISNNHASSIGSGIMNVGSIITLTNSSIISNAGLGSGLYDSTFLTTTIQNSIIAHNAGDDCNGNNIVSKGHNLTSDLTCPFYEATDITNTNPFVGNLKDNGGPTLTHALLSNSPAIDAGDNSSCPAHDQRGETRPIDGNNDGDLVCDIGAYEFGGFTTAVDDQTNTPVNTAVPIDVLANDSPGEGGVLNLSDVGLPLSGTAVISDEMILYTPTLDFTGTDVFTYTVSDGFSQDTAVVSVTVDYLKLFLPIVLKNE